MSAQTILAVCDDRDEAIFARRQEEQAVREAWEAVDYDGSLCDRDVERLVRAGGCVSSLREVEA